MPTSYALRMLSGAQPGQVFPLGQATVVLGSAAGSHILLPGLAPQHATLYWHEGRPCIADSGSPAGTMVNGARLAAPAYLNPGDTLALGPYTLQLVAQAEAPHPAYGPPPPAPSAPPVPAYGPPAPSPGAWPARRAFAPPPTPRKRGLGCGGCLAIGLGVVALACVAVAAYVSLNRPVSHNLTLGPRQTAGSGGVPAEGGTFAVTDPKSPVQGLKIEVPEGAYPKGTTFKVSTQPIEDHELGPLFTPASPLITIDNGHQFAAEPMLVEIPIHLEEDEFALAFYYDRYSGKLEGIPLAGLTRDRITLVTCHFSDAVVAKVKEEEVKGLEVDTGFAPGVDDWQFVNRGTYMAPGGQCAGMSISAMWYYLEKKVAGHERALYGRYDNNSYGYATPNLQRDDSWGYRFATMVQRAVDWDARSRTFAMFAGSLSDQFTWEAFVYAMALTREPQYVSIGRYTTDASGNQVRSGHAIVAYKIEGNRIYVADPNYPAKADRTIVYKGEAFKPYPSGGDAADIEAAGPQDYTEVRWLAKSGLVEWSTIAELYDEMLKGKAGDGAFPAWSLEYATAYNEVTDEFTWAPLPDELEIDEAATAIREELRGKLQCRFTIDRAAQLTFYHRTDQIGQLPTDAAHQVLFAVTPLKGTNDLGFYVSALANNTQRLIDFKRYKVVYGSEDWSGTWQGSMEIEQVEVLRKFIEDVLSGIVRRLNPALSEQEARDAARSSIVENPNRKAEMTLVLKPDPSGKKDRYAAEVTIVGSDGQPGQFRATAAVKKGRIAFSMPDPTSGSVMRFEGSMAEPDHITGELAGDMWGVVKDAVKGSWEVRRK